VARNRDTIQPVRPSLFRVKQKAHDPPGRMATSSREDRDCNSRYRRAIGCHPKPAACGASHRLDLRLLARAQIFRNSPRVCRACGGLREKSALARSPPRPAPRFVLTRMNADRQHGRFSAGENARGMSVRMRAFQPGDHGLNGGWPRGRSISPAGGSPTSGFPFRQNPLWCALFGSDDPLLSSIYQRLAQEARLWRVL
jgi:hypothetical protein